MADLPSQYAEEVETFRFMAHVLQRELCTMLRREAEMTLLQPHLGDTRLSPQKGTSKDAEGFGPYQTSPFVVPTIRKEVPTGNVPLNAVTNLRGKPNFRGSRGRF